MRICLTLRHPVCLRFLVRLMVLMGVVCPWTPAARAAAASRPNIVVFLTDDQGQLDSQPYGAASLRTPRMQRLADEGLVFDQAFVASPSCAPSRAALLTGMWPARNGAEANHTRPHAGLKKWPAYFQELGYEVVSFGKTSHYRHTIDYGFDHFQHDTFANPEAIPGAVEFLRSRSPEGAKPLCLLVGTNWPHVPWPTETPGYDAATIPLPAGSIDTEETRRFRIRYAAAVTRADEHLGAIRDAVREHLDDKALFVFTSDHGAQWPFGKWNCYDAGVRVPLIVSWPGQIEPGKRTAAMVSWIDLLPTLVDAAGGTPSPEIDGRSFLPVLRGTESQHRDRIFTTHSGDGQWNIYPIRSVRTPEWKYIRNLHPEFAFTTHLDLGNRRDGRDMFATWEQLAKADPAAAAIVQRYHARPAEEFYDLRQDPFEQHNLAADPVQQDRLHQFRRELDEWMQATGDRQTVFGEPRLLSDPNSYGPNAPPGNAPRPNPGNR